MKIIYELKDDEDEYHISIFKYAEDFYLALTHIDELMRRYRKGEDMNDTEKMHDSICEILADSKLFEIN